MQVLSNIKLNISSPAFSEGEDIPEKYTCDGDNIPPPLNIEELPEQTESIGIIVEDPDAPGGTFVHWLIWNISPKSSSLEQGQKTGIEGLNSRSNKEYLGPCPPKGTKHRYYFRVFALDKTLNLDSDTKKEGLVSEMKDHVIGEGSLMGYYQRK